MKHTTFKKREELSISKSAFNHSRGTKIGGLPVCCGGVNFYSSNTHNEIPSVSFTVNAVKKVQRVHRGAQTIKPKRRTVAIQTNL